MAVLNNASKREEKKEYATDPESMMETAKEYAKRDITTVLALCAKLGIDIEAKEEVIAKSLIAVKYEQIDRARNERPSYLGYFE